jgi:histidinol-phosphatase
MTRDPKEWLLLLEEIAELADGIALRLFRSTNLLVEEKPDMSPVTEADRTIEEMARVYVGKRHSDLSVYGEEQGEDEDQTGRRLIIDPIDATRNFIRGIPIFATLLAIEEAGEVVAGVVTAPALQTRWRAAKGLGSFLGSRHLRVSKVKDLGDAQLFHSDVGATAEAHPPPGFMGLLARVERARGFGDFYQHVLVAQGAGDIALDPAVMPWDIAPLQVIVEEAGGRATSLAGERTIYGGSLVTSNGPLHQAALELLASGSPAHPCPSGGQAGRPTGEPPPAPSPTGRVRGQR